MSAMTKAVQVPPTVARQPLHWWEIAARPSQELPFLGYFREGRSAWEEDPMEGELRHRIAIPVEDWEAFIARRWGDNGRLIEEWFDAGEELQHDSSVELRIEEPDRWERALHWMRSLAISTGLRPA